MTLISFLNSKNYQVYNRLVAKELESITAAVFLSELINRLEYHIENKDPFLEKDDKLWFYYTAELAEERLGVGRTCQKNAIKKLEKEGLIEQKNFGLPCKRYFWINEQAIIQRFLNSNNHSSLYEACKLDCTKRANKDVQNVQPGSDETCNPSYIKNTSKETQKEEKGGKPPNPPRAPHVSTSDDEHRKLAEEYGEELRDQAYQVLSDWKQDTQRSKWKKSDYRSIRRWVIDSINEKKTKNGKSRANQNLPDEIKDQYDGRW